MLGWELFLFWGIFGVIYCITIIGIPCGKQCFKIACFVVCPFEKEIIRKEEESSCCNCFGNVIWVIFGGLELAIIELILCGLCFITIIGIPFGFQLWKLIKITFIPYGTSVVEQTQDNQDGSPQTPQNVQVIESEEDRIVKNK